MLAGGFIGTVSGVVGIGGGTMTVPFLVWHGKAIRASVATSAACGLPIALGGAVGFVLFGMSAALPLGTGYIYWPAVVLISISSVLFAPIGAELAHRLPVSTLKRIFSLLLFVVGGRLVFF